MQINTKKGSPARIRLTKRERDALEYAREIAGSVARVSDVVEVQALARGINEDVGKLVHSLTEIDQ